MLGLGYPTNRCPTSLQRGATPPSASALVWCTRALDVHSSFVGGPRPNPFFSDMHDFFCVAKWGWYNFTAFQATEQLQVISC